MYELLTKSLARGESAKESLVELLRDIAQSIKAHQEAHNGLNLTVKELEGRKEELTSKISDSILILENTKAAGAQAAELEQNVAALRIEKEQLESALNELAESSRATEALVAQLRTTVADEETALAKLQASRSCEMADHDCLTKQIASLRTEVASLTGQKHTILSDVSDLQRQLEERRESAKIELTVRSQRDELCRVSADLEQARTTLAESTGLLDTLRSELAQAHDERTAVLQALSRAQEVAGSHKDLRTENEHLLERVHTLERELAEVQSSACVDRNRVVEMDIAHARMDSEREIRLAETSDWVKERGELQSEIAAMQLEMEELARTVADQRLRADEATSEAAHQRGRYRAVSEECAKHLARIQDLENGIAQCADDMASLEATIGALHGRIHELEGQGGAFEGGAAAAVGDIAHQINSGDVGVGSIALLQWDVPRKRWAVVNCPDVHIGAGIEAQLDLDKTKFHLVRVIYRDDSGALTVVVER